MCVCVCALARVDGAVYCLHCKLPKVVFSVWLSKLTQGNSLFWFWLPHRISQVYPYGSAVVLKFLAIILIIDMCLWLCFSNHMEEVEYVLILLLVWAFYTSQPLFFSGGGGVHINFQRSSLRVKSLANNSYNPPNTLCCSGLLHTDCFRSIFLIKNVSRYYVPPIARKWPLVLI